MRSTLLQFGILSLLAASLSAQYLEPGPVISAFAQNQAFANAYGDFDGDGRVDLILVASYNLMGSPANRQVRMYGDLAGGSGNYVASTLPTVPGLIPAGSLILRAVNIDGDAWQDLVIEDGIGRLHVYTSDGAGGLIARPPSLLTSQLQARVLDVADLDADGDDDLLVRSSSGFYPPNLVSIFMNLGGSWARSYTLTSRQGVDAFFGEFNGDFIVDLAYQYRAITPEYAFPASRFLVVAYGTPSGGFQDEQWILAGNLVPPGPGSEIADLLGAEDLDNNGIDDLLYFRSSLNQTIPAMQSWEIMAGFWDPATAAMTPVTMRSLAPGPLLNNQPLIARAMASLDGRPDILLGVHACTSNPPCTITATMVHQGPNRTFVTTPRSESLTISGISPVFTGMDVDGDGDDDLLSSSIWAGTQFYELWINRAVTRTGCAGGSAYTTSNTLLMAGGVGTFSLEGAPPGAPVAFGFGSGVSSTASCGPTLGPGLLLSSPAGTGQATGIVDSMGRASIGFTIPAGIMISGVEVFSQWAVLDTQGSLPTPFGTIALSPVGYSIVM